MTSKVVITPAMLALMQLYHKDGEVEFGTPLEQAMGVVIYNIIKTHPQAKLGRDGGDGQFSGGFFQEHYDVGNTEVTFGIQGDTICDISFKVKHNDIPTSKKKS